MSSNNKKVFHVWSHNHDGGVSWLHSGTRAECNHFVRARGNHGFYHVTTIQCPDKARRKWGWVE